MAKVSFTKLGLKLNSEVKTIQFNGQDIEIKQYLPVNDKLELISNVVNASHDGQNNFPNPVKISVFTTLEILYAYTNINFTDKQKEDFEKLYDLVISSGLVAAAVQAIPESEYNEVIKGIKDSIEAIYKYQNSILGILDSISQDYSNLQLDATDIQQKIGDPNNMILLKDILTKLG